MNGEIDMKKLAAFIWLFICASAIPAQPKSNVIVFRHANVIDAVSQKPFLDVTVTIENGRIAGIGKRPKRLPSNPEIIDLKGKWIMPGYIDAHVHLATFDAARTALLLGTTTVRTMHCEHFLDIQIRDAHRAGQKDLPDVVAAGYQIRPDMFPAFFEDFPELSGIKARVAGAENVRRVVRALISRGVDHIKFLATERSGTSETDPRKRTFSDGEIAAILEEAGREGLPASAHAHGDEGANAAVKAGVRSIEHGTFVGDETLELMKRNGTYFVLTYTGGSQPPARLQDMNDPILKERRRVSISLRQQLIRQALELGIPLAAGTDLRYITRDLSMADEAFYMQEAGLEPMTILKIMTSGSAKCLGIDNRTGAIRQGLEADILVLAESPLSSLRALKDIRMIVNDGKMIFRKFD
jgi:imidazolonepropionase-like amidohydrolase